MKTTTKFAFLGILFSSFLQHPRAFAQGTAFTYQGQLNAAGSPASGSYDLTFALFNSASGPAQQGSTFTNTAVSVSNGLFTVTLDFGAGVFNGSSYWLEIGVETNGGGSFTTLAPRQQLTPAPYAIYAESANALGGTLWASQLTSIGNTNGSATGNFFVGPSGNPTTSGSYNTAYGVEALLNDTTGFQNTANGYGALNGNTNGSFNTADGVNALLENTSGSDNTAIGANALLANTIGSYNTASGMSALGNNTIGSYNTASGMSALGNNASGSNNIALGYQAGEYIITGSSNIDIGSPGSSLDTNTIRIGYGQTQTFIAGVINGNGSGLTLNASNLANGTVADARLSSNVALRSGGNTFGGNQIVTNGSLYMDNAQAIWAKNTGGTYDLLMWPRYSDNVTYFNFGAGGFNIRNNSSASTMFMRSNGNVGIGTASPANTLDVQGPADFIGKVGIGTTSPNYPLGFASALGDKIALYDAGDGTSFGFGIQLGQLQVHGDNAGADIVFGWGSSSNLTELMRIKGSGNVGIGTTLPVNMLDVEGSADFIGNVGIGTSTPDRPLTILESNSGNGEWISLKDTINVTRWHLNNEAGGLNFVATGIADNVLFLSTNKTVGMVGIGKANPAAALDVAGEINCTAINITSDRNAKEDFQTVNPREVLAKVTALPITEWQYKADKANNASSRHIGPMAQDFSAAFALNHDDKHISVVDEGGVALAAIQGLNEKVDERDARIREQEIQIQTQTVEIRKLSQALADLQTAFGQMQQAVQ